VIDSHCHLAGDEFVADLEAVITRARAAGLGSALCILAAQDAEEAIRAQRVRALWPSIRFATGIHPHQAGEFAGRTAEAIAVVRERILEQQACAIGEIGLDYHYDFSPKEVQSDVFAAQVRLARELGLPVVIHTREATEDTLRILREEGGTSLRGVFHCFTGDQTEARAALDTGFHLSFAGIVTFPRAQSVRDSARLAPDDRLLAETDSPYLAPVPHRGMRNEPAHVVRVVETLAEIRGASIAELSQQVTRNFHTLFG
jgi:TatD DNase family protein